MFNRIPAMNEMLIISTVAFSLIYFSFNFYSYHYYKNASNLINKQIYDIKAELKINDKSEFYYNII